MLCGLSRLSTRSLTAVALFFPSAILTHHAIHPSLHTTLCPGPQPCYTPTYPTLRTTSALLLLATSTITAARLLPTYLATLTPTLQSPVADTKPALSPLSPARNTAAFFSGLLFALGLLVSGMSHPAKVASFLSFPAWDAWDPSLGLVVMFGVLPNMVVVWRRGLDGSPSLGSGFALPAKGWADIDTRFVTGAVAFGVGWGVSGTCPGPAVLRAVMQPVWGLLWMGGFWAGGRIAG